MRLRLSPCYRHDTAICLESVAYPTPQQLDRRLARLRHCSCNEELHNLYCWPNIIEGHGCRAVYGSECLCSLENWDEVCNPSQGMGVCRVFLFHVCL
jgi:hypothetical protein